MKNTKKSLLLSAISLVVCIAMLVGSTFAWFTDKVSSGKNIIVSGNLDVEMYWAKDPAGPWHNVEDPNYNTIFSYDNWEPGYTDVKYIKIKNGGSLAFNYKLAITPETAVGKLAEVINVHYATDAVKINDRTDLQNTATLGLLSNVLRDDHVIEGTLMAEGQQNPYHSESEVILTLAMTMITTAGNEYQNETAGKFSITAYAAQAPFEEDSFGANYDSAAELPIILNGGTISAGVETLNGATAKDVTLQGNGLSATIPAGTLLEEGADRVTLMVNPLEKTTSDITVVNNEILIPVDVHVDGVSEDNTTPIVVNLGQILPKGLNMGNYTLYHVEDGTNKVMTLVNSAADLSAHNTFTYDPVTGEVSVAMATFSEVALIADTENEWNGTVVTAFSGGDGSEDAPYIIANADQLAYFNEVISNDNEKYGGKYGDKYYKLIVDVNLGGEKQVFYPIGYHQEGGKIATAALDDEIPEAVYIIEEDTKLPANMADDYNKEGVWYTYGGAFKGTFDGNGHKVSNIYQNTWSMKGNYDGHYWNAAMGLFGYVYGGTVKNLTVDNFSSDGEFTPTGVISAYAANATFENIAITNCNPRVYNTGNGGIVGVGGNSGETADKQMTFTNITVDKTNKISALWGSWDVACGGIMGMFRGYSKVDFVNCNAAAQIDVFNDVCGNYQYYWYRYSGMIIGSLRGRNKVENGYTVPDLSGISATGCTVRFDEWNDYYYCELVANSLASYTHDHQMSRLEEVKSVDVENKKYVTTDGKSCDISTSGRYNFVVIEGGHKTENATCYHFVDGEQWTHEMAGEETVNGETVLKEDKQHIYLPFNQLFQGDGWGVKHVAIAGEEGKEVEINSDLKFTILPREARSDVKFKPQVGDDYSCETGTTVTIGELFEDNAPDDNPIRSDRVKVFVSPVGDDSNADGKFTANKNDWKQGTLTFSGEGALEVTITDYYFCEPTKIVFTVKELGDREKFKSKFTGNFLYRVGNQNSVSLSSLFEATEDKLGNNPIYNGSVAVNIAKIKGDASGSYTENASDWTKGTIKFSGTGVVTVTITDNKNCNPTVLTLEVIDATNAISATSATKNNVVLLNDCGFSSLEVSGGYTLYGNGFTMTCGSDSAALDMGYSFVTLNNGTLDNVQIVTPNFDYAVLYKSNMTESGNRSETTDRTRYFNVKSGVMVSGNSQILNSRISGARAAVNVTGGNLLIDNSRIERGAVASILVGSANRLTLRDVTLVQKPTASTHDSSKTLMGFSVLCVCDADGNAAPITIEGTLVQNAWVDEDDKQYVPSAGESIISTVLGKTDYLHDLDGDGKNESLNLGFAYMPESLTSKVNTTTITDNRTNKSAIPYNYAEVSILNGKTYVYSYENSKGTADAFKTESKYKPNKQSDIITVSYADKADGLETSKTFGTNGWVYELNVDLDKNPGYRFSFDNLSMTVNGAVITDYKVNDAAKPTSPVAVNAGGVTYTLTATVEGKTHTATYKVIGTETSKESPSKISGPTTAGFGVAKSYGGDWSGAADVLTGVKVKYWSVAENKYVEFDFSNFTVPGNAGKLNGTNSYWEYTHTNNDFTLKVTNTVAIHSGKSVFGMPIRGTDGKLYFTISSTNGYVGSGTTSRAVTMQYEFTDNNGGEKLTFTHTFNISYNKDDQYSYSDLSGSGKLTKLVSSSGGSSDGCVTPDTLITLADGSKVRVDSLTGHEELLVWNLETGKLDKAPIMFVDSDPEAEYEVIKLHFSDGTEVKVISEHGFWDYDLNRYVYLDRNAADYIGHTFAKQGADGLEKVVLTDVVIETEVTTAWSPVTVGHLCYFTNDMLSMPGGVGGLFNIFEVDAETMTYDYEALARDIETYGLFTYEEINAIAPLSEEMFYAAGGQYLKISIGKGNMTEAELAAMIKRYSKYI